MKTQRLIKTLGLMLMAGTSVNCLGGGNDGTNPSTGPAPGSAHRHRRRGAAGARG